MNKRPDKTDPFPNLLAPNMARRFRPAIELKGGGIDPPCAEVERLMAGDVRRGRGRPKTVKPWEGICSKSEWYRRKKGK
jgi:hypothetical protein